MKICITTPSDEHALGRGIKGGNQLIMESLAKAINKYTKHEAETLFLPLNHYPNSSLLRSYLKYYAKSLSDLSDYDMVISSKFPSYAIRHDNHICYFAHRFRQFYDFWPDYKNQISGLYKASSCIARPIIRRIDTHFLKKARIVAYSKFLQARLKSAGLGSELVYAPPHIEDNEFRQGSYDYIFLPHILDDSRKRISLVIRAMKHIKADIRLKIAGEGPHRKQLMQLAKKDNRIEFLGYKSDNQLARLYSDALCVPFTSYLEDYGLVTVEAMKSAKPVITCTDSGGPLEFVVHNKTGLVCTPDPKSVAECLDFLINNRKDAKKIGKNGLKSVRDITWKNAVKTIISYNVE
ncbi:glycosyltransferase [Candidatus Woesearchaeota archaeon]|nr:glycosyltransferase [Candidatus Woesearchaeota archaeon]